MTNPTIVYLFADGNHGGLFRDAAGGFIQTGTRAAASLIAKELQGRSGRKIVILACTEECVIEYVFETDPMVPQ